MNNEWQHLGDGVYAKYDGFGIELRANNPVNPTDVVYLEPSVLSMLNMFNERWTGQDDEESLEDD